MCFLLSCSLSLLELYIVNRARSTFYYFHAITGGVKDVLRL